MVPCQLDERVRWRVRAVRVSISTILCVGVSMSIAMLVDVDCILDVLGRLCYIEVR